MKAQGSHDFVSERVLIVEVNWLGDVLFSTPAIRAIRQIHPGAYIAALVVARGQQVLAGNNYIDEVIVLDEEVAHRGFFGGLKLIRQLRQRRFTTAYFFKPFLTRIIWACLAGIKKRIAARTRKSAWALTQAIELPKEIIHRADQYHYLVTKSPIPVGDRHYDFFIKEEDKKFIEALLAMRLTSKFKSLVVMHVAANWELKRWPREYFARLADILFERFQAAVVISGSVDDAALAGEVAAQALHQPVVLCGETTLSQLGALFQKSDLVISADSGPLHVAAAVNARLIALFGPTSPDMTGPLGRGEIVIMRSQDASCAVPCYQLDCRDNRCMRGISVERVVAEIEKREWLKP